MSRPPRSAGVLLLAGALLGACAGRAPAPGPAGWCVEAERVGAPSAGQAEPSLLASAGMAWAAASTGAQTPALVLPVGAWNAGPVRLWVRGAVAGPGAALDVTWAGRPQGRLELAGTGQRDRFEWSGLPLAGPLPDGTLTLTPVGASAPLLDLVALRPAGAGPPTGSAPAIHREDGREIRCSSTATVFDPPWVFRLLRRQERYVEQVLGFALERPPVLAAVDPGEWPDPGAEAFQIGGILFLRSDRLHLPWRGYTHELVHLFQEEAAPTPRFFLEGVAHVVALWAERDLDGRAAELRPRLAAQRRLLERGTPPLQDQVADLFRWGTAELPPDRVAAAYAWSQALLWELAEQRGPEWLQETYRLLRRPQDPDVQALVAGAGTLAAARPLLRILSRAAGEDLAPWWETRGLPLPPDPGPGRIPGPAPEGGSRMAPNARPPIEEEEP